MTGVRIALPIVCHAFIPPKTNFPLSVNIFVAQKMHHRTNLAAPACISPHTPARMDRDLITAHFRSDAGHVAAAAETLLSPVGLLA